MGGLFLDGGRWDADAHEMAEQKPKELFTVMPHIHLLPKPKKDILGVEDTDPGGTAHVYRCPTYKTSIRFGVLSTTGIVQTLSCGSESPWHQNITSSTGSNEGQQCSRR